MPAELGKDLGLSAEDQERLAQSGMDLSMGNRCGSYIQMNQDIVQESCTEEGIEVLSIWECPQKIRLDQGLYLETRSRRIKMNTPGMSQMPTIRKAMSSSPTKGAVISCRCRHVSISVVKKSSMSTTLSLRRKVPSFISYPVVQAASMSEKAGHTTGYPNFTSEKMRRSAFTMIHTWGEDIDVYPRSAANVEENGVFLSNYVCMKPVHKVQMYPTANLIGENSVARFSSVVIAMPGSTLDFGSRAILGAKGASAELVTRAITKGGTIISRGHILGKTEGTKGHLECKGLILKDGTIYAIPEIEGNVVGTELSHEAAVGKIARDEIEYLMSRGLDEESATATIIRGFLDVKIAGLPDALQKQIDAAIDVAEKAGF